MTKDETRKNTPQGEIIRGYVERLERLNDEGKKTKLDIAEVKAEAKSNGYNVPAIMYIVKRRAKKPNDLLEQDTLNDIYSHAVGMDIELPLFRGLETAVKDPASEASVLDALKSLAPSKGDIIMRNAGKELRIFRDEKGVAHVEDYTPAPSSAPASGGSIAQLPHREPKEPVPDCSLDEAEALGEAAFRENKRVIDNPFPFGDKRRPRWDMGWQKAAGDNGFGGK